MIPLLYVCNIFCSAGQSACGKKYALCGGNAFSFNVTKALAGMLMFLIWGAVTGFSFHLPTVLFGVIYGVALCVSMHTGFKALAIGPMALTSIIASFSLIIPFFFGICFWNEPLTAYKTVGLALLLASIFLINAKKEGRFSLRWLIYAVITLIANGVSSVVLKMHQIQFPTLYRTELMFWALLCVLAVLFAMNAVHRETAEPVKFSVLGAVSGIMNCLANYIVLYLSATENASVMFPIVSVANIMAVWAIGVFYFRERLKLLQVVGLLVGVASVVLLKL